MANGWPPRQPRPQNSPRKPAQFPRRGRLFCRDERDDNRNDARHSIPSTLPSNWTSWPELTVRLHGMPVDITTHIIHQSFSQYGDIDYIDIYEPKGGAGTMSVRLVFAPPPSVAFWEKSPYMFEHPDQVAYPHDIPIHAVPDRQCPDHWYNSHVSVDRSYPLRTSAQLTSLGFGAMTGSDRMTLTEHLEPAPGLEFKIELHAARKKLWLWFHTISEKLHGQQVRTYKIEIDVSQVSHIHRIRTMSNDIALVFSLPFPPQYFWRMENATPSEVGGLSTWSQRDSWYRATGVADELDKSLKYPVKIAEMIDRNNQIDIGRWKTFHLVLKNDQDEKFRQLVEALGDVNIDIHATDRFVVEESASAEMWTLLDSLSGEATSSNAMAMLMMSNNHIHLPFEVRYQLEVCISRGMLPEHKVSRQYLTRLAALDPRKAQYHLECLADNESVVYDPGMVLDLSEKEDVPEARPIPEYCYLMRKAVVTPTTMCLNTPSFETSYRVVRKYSHVADRFLKVQFAEEGESGRLKGSAGLNTDEVWKRVWRTVDQGIQIGDRRYEFLAFGSSQLRENGAYFFCPTEHLSCDDIRNWAGDFLHIRVPAKHAARMGQCFSTTRDLRGIPVTTIRYVPDIEKNGHCFSDGCGKISRFLAQIIGSEMHLDEAEMPTAFQFRMGGCKGVLAVSDDVKGNEVHIRPSQEKFRAQFNGLEIIRCARYSTALLNRQTIIILHSLGVPRSAFLTLQGQQLRLFEQALRDVEVAIDLLVRMVDPNHTALVAAALLRCGFRTDG